MNEKIELKKIKHKGKHCYKLSIILKKYDDIGFLNGNMILKSRNSYSYNLLYMNYIRELKESFMEKYSKIDTIELLSKYIGLNEFRLQHELKRYGLVDEYELIFKSNDIEDLKKYLSKYFDAVHILSKLTI